MAKYECPSCYGTGDRPDMRFGVHTFVPCAQCEGKGHIEPILAKRDRFYEEAIRNAAYEEAAKLCEDMYANDVRVVGSECLRDAAHRIRSLKPSAQEVRDAAPQGGSS